MFNGLHGRALPVATALKAVNPGLCVIAEGGDGDMYGEGGNHFLAAVRRNVNIVHLVHNNMVYGLTKGQASPTSMPGFTTPVQVKGVVNEPFNPIAAALALNASFISRVSTGQADHALHVIKEAFVHPGYALVDIFQPCPTFNRINTHRWFQDNTYLLEEAHDPTDRSAAFARAIETKSLPLGIFYRRSSRSFEETLWHDYDRKAPIWTRTHDLHKIRELFASYR
jgi:2-oxoglutarate ferredoxin oxidoreductase subunit beta